MSIYTPVVVLLLVAACRATIHVGPSNHAFEPGAQVTLYCQGDPADRIMWKEFTTTPAGGLISDGSSLMPGHPNAPRYSLSADQPTGWYNLTISGLVIADGGTYECTDEVTPHTSEIIMIEGPANCTTGLPLDGMVVVGVYYTVECSQYHRGNVAPYMHWTGPGDFSQLYEPYNSSLFSGVSFLVQKIMTAERFTATTNFTQAAFPGVGSAATNVPTYMSVYNSQQLFPIWGPMDVHYVPVKDPYDIGDIVTCVADANPAGTYTWTDMITLIDYPGDKINLTEDMVGPVRLRCQVVNGVSSANILVNSTLLGPSTTPPSTTTPASTTPPAVSNCLDLTGRWEFVRSAESKAVLCLYVDSTQNGRISGLLWNDTAVDTYYLEIEGQTRNNLFDETGLIGIWPLQRGVTAFAAECHRCHGVESLLINPVSRQSSDYEYCGHGGFINYGPQYDMIRVEASYPCAPGTTYAEMRQAVAEQLQHQAI